MVLGNNTNELRIHVNTRHDANIANLTSTSETLYSALYIHLLATCLYHTRILSIRQMK
jgi:hypothetical protein